MWISSRSFHASIHPSLGTYHQLLQLILIVRHAVVETGKGVDIVLVQPRHRHLCTLASIQLNPWNTRK